jgi:hypothetical protein
MTIEPKLRLPHREAQKIVRLVQRHLRFLFWETHKFAMKKQMPMKKLLVLGMERGSLFRMMDRGAFQSELGFPVDYNPSKNVSRALLQSIKSDSWISSRTIRLMRVSWFLDYDELVERVRYKLPSGKGQGGYMHWMKYVTGEASMPGYAFKRIATLAGGAKRASRSAGSAKKPRAYNRPGVGGVHAGYMFSLNNPAVKGSGPWQLSQPVPKDWYREKISSVSGDILSYWKNRVEMIHRHTLRKYKTYLRSAT